MGSLVKKGGLEKDLCARFSDNSVGDKDRGIRDDDRYALYDELTVFVQLTICFALCAADELVGIVSECSALTKCFALCTAHKVLCIVCD